MSCEDDGVCGTGLGNNLPKPGDPSNGSALSAVTVFGGINVSWAYPSVNPHAVSYTRLYRGLTDSFVNAAEVGTIAGSIYFDKMDPKDKTAYFYWIKIVSVNGTIGELIGPATAFAMPIGEQTLKSITGRIDAGVLAQSLKKDIDSIIDVNKNLHQEVMDRLAHNEALQNALNAVQSSNGQTATYVLNEVTERKTADTALVNAINAIAAGVGENAAAIVTEREVRATKDEAFARDITTLFTTTGDNTAAIIDERTSRTTQYDAMAQQYHALAAETAGNKATIVQEVTARTNAIEAVTLNTNRQLSEYSQTSAAAIQSEATTRATAVDAVSSKVDTVEIRLNGNISQAETRVETKVNLVGDKVDTLGSLWTTKVSVNGLVGGFGVYNDGRTVEAGFDVDTFWIGRTNSDKVKPFIVDRGIVYIDIARIRDGDVGTLKIQGNAVTVPVTSYGGGASGNGSWQVINSAQIYLDYPGYIYAHCLAAQFYGTGTRNWNMAISIDGAPGMTIGGLSVTVAPAVSISRLVGAGMHTITVTWMGENAGVRITQSEMFAMGGKK